MILTSANLCIVGALSATSGVAMLLLRAGDRKRTSGTVWVPLAVAAVLGAFTAARWLAGAADGLGMATGVVALGWLGLALLRFSLLAQLARMLAQPVVQGLMLLVVGAGLAAWGSWRLDSDLRVVLAESEAAMPLQCAPPEFVPAALRECRTDVGRKVALKALKPGIVEEMTSRAESDYLRTLQLEMRLIQTGAADLSYNCHGWVFGAGRCWIGGAQVPHILMDNGYLTVKVPAPGDVAVYTDEAGEVTHTALVRGSSERGPLLESKWGMLGRFVHTSEEHIYRANKIAYYRTGRGSHTLAGLEVTPQIVVAQ